MYDFRRWGAPSSGTASSPASWPADRSRRRPRPHRVVGGEAGIGKSALVSDLSEVRPGGKPEPLGVEYVVFKAEWDAANPAPPELFGQEFNVVEEPNRYGIPRFYELHAWARKPNPTGAHEDWHPTVLCPGTEGHTH